MATSITNSICLWFDNQAEEAAKFYTGIFNDSKVGRISYFGKEGYEIHQRPEGSVSTVQFFINGMEFLGLNGGPLFKFNEAVSIVVNCDTQQEIDEHWEKLSKGGDDNAQQCGWLKDKYGLSWQIVPRRLDEMVAGKPTEKSERAMKAMLQMKKLDLAKLEAAYEGK